MPRYPCKPFSVSAKIQSLDWSTLTDSLPALIATILVLVTSTPFLLFGMVTVVRAIVIMCKIQRYTDWSVRVVSDRQRRINDPVVGIDSVLAVLYLEADFSQGEVLPCAICRNPVSVVETRFQILCERDHLVHAACYRHFVGSGECDRTQSSCPVCPPTPRIAVSQQLQESRARAHLRDDFVEKGYRYGEAVQTFEALPDHIPSQVVRGPSTQTKNLPLFFQRHLVPQLVEVGWLDRIVYRLIRMIMGLFSGRRAMLKYELVFGTHKCVGMVFVSLPAGLMQHLRSKFYATPRDASFPIASRLIIDSALKAVATNDTTKRLVSRQFLHWLEYEKIGFELMD